MEGSPVDRLFYFGMIALALLVLVRRQLDWASVFSRNWPIFLFYGFLLISVLWAESSSVSFKRWFKDIGNVFVALVILTERNPLQAIRAVFVRCAFILLPLSVIFIRFFPSLGRRYSVGGELEPTGVTFQKNSLGALVLVCGLVLAWDWIERTRQIKARQNRAERYMPLALLFVGAYLLYLCDSKTSIVCLILGAAVLGAAKFPNFRRKVGAVGVYGLVGAVLFYIADSSFGISAAVVEGLGRDMTFTGRTDVWRELLALETDPIFGTGFCSFWSDQSYQSRLPNWVAFSAHNGYLETYIDGGWIGIFFLGILLIALGWRTNQALKREGNYPLVKAAFFLSILIGNLSESHFGRMGPLWFAFLLTALELPSPLRRRTSAHSSVSDGLPTLASSNTSRMELVK